MSSILSASWNFSSLPCLGAPSEWLRGELLTQPACAVAVWQFLQIGLFFFFLAIDAGLVGSLSVHLPRERRVK